MNDEPLLLPQHAESLHQAIDYQASCRAFAEPIQQLGVALTLAFQQMAQAFAPVVKMIADATSHAIDALMQAYIEDGMPYGNDSAGMWRWVKEQAERHER